MQTITKADYYKKHKDYRGVYSDFDGTRPDLKGKRTMLTNEGGATVLIIEGQHFQIVEGK